MSDRPSDQLWLPGLCPDESPVTEPGPDYRRESEQLMEGALERSNLMAALRRVERNAGGPGVDGMSVKELRPYLSEHWSSIRQSLLAGRYKPSPVRRVYIPKSGGGQRKLGIPTVLDRFIQQALLQVLQPKLDPSFSESSFGFRPGRNAHQAVAQAQAYLREGYEWVVDLDLEKFFDRVNHDKLMHVLGQRVRARRVVELVGRYLRAGVLEDDALHATREGTPQGGPLSPLLANLLLDEFDRELERRGHRFVRYADDSNIYVRSRRAGHRVLKSVTRFLASRLKLSVNQAKSAVGRPWERKFLGFSFTWGHRRRLSKEALSDFKQRVRQLTRRTRGRTLATIVQELRRYLVGWRGYFGYIEARSILKELDSWIRRKLRCYLWKQWGRRGYRELRKRGVSVRLAWNTTKSAHGPWRLSRSPGLAFALPGSYFDGLGLPRLYVRGTL